jgi:hypothetical protein
LQQTNSAARAFLEQQNRFRGLVAAYNSRQFVENRSIPLSQDFRSGLRELLLDARAALDPRQYEGFLTWINEQTRVVLGKLKAVPLGYEELTGVIFQGYSSDFNRPVSYRDADAPRHRS